MTKPVLLDDFYFLKTTKEQREKVISFSKRDETINARNVKKA